MNVQPASIQSLLGPDFRPCDALTTKFPDTFRIVVTGDSLTYGLGARAAESLPAELGARFSAIAARPEIEVANLGRPGLSLFSAHAVVHRILELIELDLLLLVLSNDDSMAWQQKQAAERELDWTALWRARWDPEGEVVRPALDALDSIARAVRARACQLAVAFYGPVGALGKQAAGVIGGACRERGVPFIDLVAPFARFDAERLVVSVADAHPSAFAHRIAAAEVEQALRPMLPRRTAIPEEDRGEAILMERLNALDAANAELSTVVQQTLACSAVHPEDRTRLTKLYTALQRAVFLIDRLRAAEPTVAELSEMLIELETRLVLTTLGVRGAGAGEELAATLAVLRTAAKQMLECVAGSAEPRTASRTSSAATPIGEVAERIEARRREIERQVCSSLGTIRALAVSLCSLVERTVVTHVPSDVLAMVSGATRAFDVLERACREPPSEQSVEIVVDGAVDVTSDVTCAMLTGTFTSVFPTRREFRQLNYLRVDGRALSCVFDLPPGAVGTFSLTLSLWRGAHESVSDRDTGVRCKVVGASGGLRPYRDELLVVKIGS